MSLETTVPQQGESGNSSRNKGSDGRYRVLVEFAYRHLDFLMAELESVLRMNGIVLGGGEGDCQAENLLHQARFDESVRERSAADPLQKLSRRPFVILSFPPDSSWAPQPQQQQQQQQQQHHHHQQQQQAANNDSVGDGEPTTSCCQKTTKKSSTIGDVLLDRCVLVRSVIELWGMAPTIEACAQAVRDWSQSSPLGREIRRQRHNSNLASRSWKLSVHTLGSTYQREEQEAMRRHFAFLEFPGPVIMKEPNDEYILIREVELDHKGGAVYPRHDFRKQLVPENDARPPLCWYFGRVMGGTRAVKGRGKVGTGNLEDYSLKKRAYLGPTSMDTELSLVMTNLGHVKNGSMVLDPFCGTGSILIASALRGAYCVGTDIDIRVLRGRSRDENVFSNFRQYQLPRPELIRSDNAMYSGHFRSHPPLYDAIVCDPPYGIRAGARKTGNPRENVEIRPLTEEERKDHVPQTRVYPVSDVMADLLDMAARTMVTGGRLVYVIPSHADFDPESDLPRHPCLETIHICYQPLSMELGRRLVAMKKIAEYDETKKEEYMKHVWKNGPASAEKCANIRDKIYEAAKLKPGYEEKLAIRKQKRKQHKEAKKEAKKQKEMQEGSS